MDPSLGFSHLLGIAQGNQKDRTISDVKLLKTKLSGPKKEKREKGKVAPNVQKFLQQREAEEKKKRIEEKLKLQRLNELRSDKAKNKIAKHLKVTKSANKAVLNDAIDRKNTAVTLSGKRQCDEDDYGFESSASASIYEKLMSKYESVPDDPMAKFNKSKPKGLKDLQGAKDRVKQALRKEEEDPLIPGKRRRKRKEGETCDIDLSDDVSSSKKYNSYERREDDKKNSDKRRKEEEARRKRLQNAKKAPPPVDFQSLLKMANEKKDIPVKIEKKVKVKESEFGDRPMTKQEKENFMRENEARLRREGKWKEKTPPPPKVEKNEKRSNFSEERTKVEKPKLKPEPGPMFHTAVKKSMPPPEQRKIDAERSAYEREKREMETRMRDLERKRDELDKKQKIAEYNELKRMEFEKRKEDEKRKELKEKQERRRIANEYEEMKRKMKLMEEQLKGGERMKVNGDSSSSRGGKRDINSVESRAFPGEKRRPEQIKQRKGDSSYKRRIESDSEEEYDSELEDNFIDDSDCKVDISAEIRSIFGYDKRKYRDEDFDDRSMENNKFSSIMMEEARSARIGRMEDLEDMKREEEELKRKKKRR